VFAAAFPTSSSPCVFLTPLHRAQAFLPFYPAFVPSNRPRRGGKRQHDPPLAPLPSSPAARLRFCFPQRPSIFLKPSWWFKSTFPSLSLFSLRCAGSGRSDCPLSTLNATFFCSQKGEFFPEAVTFFFLFFFFFTFFCPCDEVLFSRLTLLETNLRPYHVPPPSARGAERALLKQRSSRSFSLAKAGELFPLPFLFSISRHESHTRRPPPLFKPGGFFNQGSENRISLSPPFFILPSCPKTLILFSRGTSPRNWLRGG